MTGTAEDTSVKPSRFNRLLFAIELLLFVIPSVIVLGYVIFLGIGFATVGTAILFYTSGL